MAWNYLEISLIKKKKNFRLCVEMKMLIFLMYTAA